MEKPIRIGAVAYDQRVVPIWEGMRDYFREVGPPIDYVLFSNYDSQVQALLDGVIDIGWNTNLAWVKVYLRTEGACRALAMRDVDARFTTVFVARGDSGIASLPDLRGKRLALGSADSGQAAILPIHYLQQVGLEPKRDCTLIRFDLDVGKHGDTGTSELEVLQALSERRADAGALAQSTWDRMLQKEKVDPSVMRPIWTSPGYCHCNFTVLADFPEERGRRWTDSLVQMRYDDPKWRGLMELEGLKRWIRPDPAVMEGYRVLFDAVEKQGLLSPNPWRHPLA
jgi:ABC-type phosphate/phosphonate transport system substrate-binding protein